MDEKKNEEITAGDKTPIPDSPYMSLSLEDHSGAAASPDSDAEILRALLRRPGFSIRARLALGLLLLFTMSAGISITAIITLNRFERTLRFLEAADSFTNEIQQARRYEKNYFLYGYDITNGTEHTSQAETLLDSSRDEWGQVVGDRNVAIIENHLDDYKKLVEKLRNFDGRQVRPGNNEYQKVEEELRLHGSEMVSLAMEMSGKERAKINSMIRISKIVPVVFLVALLLVMFYEANFLTRHIIRRLNRLMEATKRIAEGDFTPIMPHRRFRDEFTNLAAAMNTMMSQLMHRHEVLVRSHKLRAVGTLTAGVAHELNNPINNIMLTAEMLKEDYDTLSAEERLDMISDLVGQAERSRKIVHNLLDFARESEINNELLDVGDILRETVALAGNQIKIRNVKTILDIHENLPPVHGDKQHLNQVFLNIILNALDAIPGCGKLFITAQRADEPGFIAVIIADTGCGIPEYIIGSIFDPFFTTKPTGKGTGLGLSVSLGIIRKHGGDIKVQSRENEGSTFTILLPVTTMPADIGNVKSTKNV